MKKIIFICPYFGKFPGHFQLWLDSCATNKEIDWLILTDDSSEYNFPENVKIRYTTLVDLKDLFQKKIDFPIALSTIKKLGDYKPLFGFFFEEEIKEYEFWGHIDLADEIYGDIRKFITDEIMEKHDKIMLFGHMSLYRNTPEVNRRFMADSGEKFNYKSIFSSEEFYNFEEIAKGSIGAIYKYNGWKIGRLEHKIADLRCVTYDFQFGVWSDDLTNYTVSDKRPAIFSREGNSVYCYYLKNNDVCKEEFIYVHFKRRKMPGYEAVNGEDRYLMLPSGFEKFQEVTPKLIRKANKGPIFYPVYWNEKKKAITDRLKKIF